MRRKIKFKFKIIYWYIFYANFTTRLETHLLHMVLQILDRMNEILNTLFWFLGRPSPPPNALMFEVSVDELDSVGNGVSEANDHVLGEVISCIIIKLLGLSVPVSVVVILPIIIVVIILLQSTNHSGNLSNARNIPLASSFASFFWSLCPCICLYHHT